MPCSSWRCFLNSLSVLNLHLQFSSLHGMHVVELIMYACLALALVFVHVLASRSFVLFVIHGTCGYLSVGFTRSKFPQQNFIFTQWGMSAKQNSSVFIFKFCSMLSLWLGGLTTLSFFSTLPWEWDSFCMLTPGFPSVDLTGGGECWWADDWFDWDGGDCLTSTEPWTLDLCEF